MITMLGYDQAQDARTITLLDLVAAIAETGASEDEVIATVAHLMASGRVTLIGNFREAELASLDHGGVKPAQAASASADGSDMCDTL